MPTKQEIGEALDAALKETFPDTDQHNPQTELTRRMATIMDNVATLLVLDGHPFIEGYNYHQVGSEVDYNVRQPMPDGGMIVGSYCCTLDEVGSDKAITDKIAQRWRDKFNGVEQIYKLKGT